MNTAELLAARPRQTTQRMVIPVDSDTTRRLERVIAMRLDSDGVLRHQTETREVDNKEAG